MLVVEYRGGFDLGFERAGMRCLWQVEKDEFCRKVLAKHWPDVQRYEDVRHVGEHNLERVDVICGGFPCQDISHVGKGAGITGERSGLWFEYSRIIRELRPHFVVVENVSALLVRGLSTVLGNLTEIGYDAEWEMLPAYAFNLPHRRERVFLIAYPRGTRQGVMRFGELQEISSIDWQGFLLSGRVGKNNGVPGSVDRNIGHGNAVVPAISEFIGCLLQRAHNNKMQPTGNGPGC